MNINGSGPVNMNRSQLIRECIRLAEQAVRNGNHPFGALLVLGEKIIVTAENSVVTERDWTRHAELNLISAAMRDYDAQTVSRCILYASTEPCAMCSGAIYRAEISRVVFGCSSDTLGSITGRGLDITSRQIFAAGRRSVEVIGPILEDEASEAHRRFWK